jgi:hypothetical protein
MGSGVGAGAMFTDHEPGRIPGGGTPPSTAGETPAATEAWFMGRDVFLNMDTYWGHEPGREAWSGRPSSRPSPGGRRRIVTTGIGGLRHLCAGTSRGGACEWGCGLLQREERDSLSLWERVGVRELGSILAMGCMERRLFEADLITSLEPGIPGGGGITIRIRSTMTRGGSWEAALAQAPCSQTMNQDGFRGAARPPSTAGETPAATDDRFTGKAASGR